jgi:hypothetical protein
MVAQADKAGGADTLATSKSPCHRPAAHGPTVREDRIAQPPLIL